MTKHLRLLIAVYLYMTGCGGDPYVYLSDLSVGVGKDLAAAADLSVDDAGPPDLADLAPLTFDVTATITTTGRHQTLAGFGAAIVYYTGYVSSRTVVNDDIYNVLFKDLGLDILRIGNWYQNQSASGTTSSSPFTDDNIVTVVQKATTALGHAPKVLMSSWSPPGYLKSSGLTKGPTASTLKSVSGAYQYAEFGNWWVSALAAYAAKGIKPDYISLQNEPDYFNSGWETCLFDATENVSHAGYPGALDAVYSAIGASSLTTKPKIIGAEPTGIGTNNVQNYLRAMNVAHIDGIAHHLYNGGNGGDDPLPDSFSGAMTGVATAATTAGKPTFMTEFSPNAPTMLNTAWLIHNALTVEGVSAYIYWSLIWAPPTTGTGAALVDVENPGTTYTLPKGYRINDVYYALKHFAKWTDPGWTRIDVASTSTAVKVSAFESPTNLSVTVIALNVDTVDHVLKVAPGGFAYGTISAYRTSGASERAATVAMAPGNVVALPAQSIVTITLTP